MVPPVASYLHVRATCASQQFLNYLVFTFPYLSLYNVKEVGLVTNETYFKAIQVAAGYLQKNSINALMQEWLY